jgi:Zn-dependent peptidase ImmA (M78 family)
MKMLTEEQISFETYAQTRYDFNLDALTSDDIIDLKTLSKEKRVDYGIAPIGRRIFRYINDNAPDISFMLADLSVKVDAILYIPHAGSKRAYIILNSKQPLVNQIFATVHEYYHYIKDYEAVRNKPYACSLSSLQNVAEQKASRFAAEFLLPTSALINDLEIMKKRLNIKKLSSCSCENLAFITIALSIKYEMPIKAILYRLCEERYTNDINKTLKQYSFIKSVLQEVKLTNAEFIELFEPIDQHFFDYEVYDQLNNAFKSGFISNVQLLNDAEVLGLEPEKIQVIIGDNNNEDELEDHDEDELIDKIIGKWGDH